MHDQTLLQQFNCGLHEIREVFHKNGRLDDSNTKLDEVVKLLCLEVAGAYEPSSGVPSLKSLVERKGPSDSLVKDINGALAKAARLDVFRNSDGESLLGANPRLSLADSEGELAGKLARLVVETFNGHLRSPESPKTFELVNEAFGHFVRDNFRNNIEDAQYMTPPEVVDYMCELAVDEVRPMAGDSRRRIIACDPSCGVGSFLAQFYRIWLHSRTSVTKKITLVGQDKVDRMARLAKLNLLLFGAKDATVTRGNSLLLNSELDEYHERCDIILTNPPFGARFHTSELAFHSLSLFPCLHDFIQTADANIDSELLFIDRYFSLLRPGGAALVVVPDAVISAAGLGGLIREYLQKKCSVVSITELPAVTFAQAGTRTKTCVLHFRKQEAASTNRVFFSCAKSLGFEVSSRKGVPYKKHEGQNELPAILETVRTHRKNGNSNSVAIHSEVPSCVSVPERILTDEPWTPNHHSSSRYTTLATLDERGSKGGVELVRLKDLVTLPNQHKRGIRSAKDTKCISVLHVGDFGSLNIRELMAYSPKYPGQLCSPGDVLFSKINPRIPRALVVPELGFPLTCSTEFEVMQAREPYTAHEVMLLLLTSHAQSQIHSLTSGTSSSHNRIKTEQLLNILLPVPKGKRRQTADYAGFVEGFRHAHTELTKASIGLYQSWERVDCLLGK